MSKFLNETGLSHFWTKVKEYLKNKFVAIGDTITFNEDKETITLSQNGLSTKNVFIGKDSISVDTQHGNGHFSVNADNESMTVEAQLGNEGQGNIHFDATPSITLVSPEQSNGISGNTTIGAGVITLGFADEDRTESFAISIGEEDGIYIKKNSKEDNVNCRTTFGFKGFDTHNYDTDASSEITPEYVKAPKFVKYKGTASQVLLANGEVSTLNAAGGIPKLNDQGKLDASLVDIDNTLFEVVTALPTADIKKSRIYLVPNTAEGADNNTYIEYIYLGDIDATYDSTKWEKLGEYKADIDLTPYAKKADTVKSIDRIDYGKDNINLEYSLPDDPDPVQLPINAATTTQAGVMSATDKKFIDIFSARYPLKISSLTASPSLLEVGTLADITLSWAYENNDLHTPQILSLNNFAGTDVVVRGTTYKDQSVAALDTAGTKAATLTVNYDTKTDNPKSITRSVNITYHYPSYIGVVADGATIDAAAVTALTKSVEWGKGKTAALTQANQKIVYAYPASYGDLTSIKDGNGFQGFAGYTKQTVTINGQAYNVYVQNLPATSSSTYTFA